MKKLLLLLILSLFALHNSHSQEWFPVGAEWHYSWTYHLPFPPYSEGHPQPIRVLKDTVVKNRVCKKVIALSGQFVPSQLEEVYLFDSAGKVYYYPSLFSSWNVINQDDWSLLYDFTKSVGDTIFYENMREVINPNDTIVYYNVVDSVFYQVINGDTLKSYYATPPDQNFGFAGFGFATNPTEVFGEGGPVFYQLDWLYQSFSYSPGGMRCYSDPNLGFYKAPNWSFSCDTIYRPTANLDDLEDSEISVFPNPASSKLNIKFSTYLKYSFMIIYDLQGNLLKQTEIIHESQSLDVSELKPGIYIYEIESQGRFHRNKLIIE